MVARSVIGRTCPRCGGPILWGQAWDLDHVDEPWADGGRGRRLPAHRWCNRSAGAKLGNQRRRARKEVLQMEWRTLGVEVAADRSKTWLARAGVTEEGKVVAHLDDPLVGAGVAFQVAELADQLEVEAVAVDPRSPSATLVEPLQAEGVWLQQADAAAMALAQGRFKDLLRDGRLRLSGHGALDTAGRLAVERRLAGSAAIDRYKGVDVAPLVAVELAVWALGDVDHPDGLGPDDVTVQPV
jgi:hypothetical protein